MARITKNRLINRRLTQSMVQPIHKSPISTEFNKFEILEFLRIDACFKLGIMPPSPFELADATISQRRKFRKLWRKLARENVGLFGLKGDPKKFTPQQKKIIVMSWIESTLVQPAFEAIQKNMSASKS